VRKSSVTPEAGSGCRGILGAGRAALFKGEAPLPPPALPGPAGMLFLSGGETWPEMGRGEPRREALRSAHAAGLTREAECPEMREGSPG